MSKLLDSSTERLKVIVISDDATAVSDLVTELTEQGCFDVEVTDKEEVQSSGICPETIYLTKASGSRLWLAKKSGHSVLPPMTTSLGRSLAKVERYHKSLQWFGLFQENPGTDVDVAFRISCLRCVKPYDSRSKEQRLSEGLKEDVLYGDNLQTVPKLNAHKCQFSEDGSVNRVEHMTGDALVYQVTNNTSRDVHVCVMLFGVDGSVECIFPPKYKGRSAVLHPGRHVEDIFRLFIPKDAFKNFPNPEVRHPDAPYGRESLVLLVSENEADLRTLIQSGPCSEPHYKNCTSERDDYNGQGCMNSTPDTDILIRSVKRRDYLIFDSALANQCAITGGP